MTNEIKKKKQKMIKSFRHDKEAAMEFFKMLVEAVPTADIEIHLTKWWNDGGSDYEYSVVVNANEGVLL